MIKYKYSKVYWFFRRLEWMRVYFSPFKPIIPRLYIGKIAIGTPYFLPRRWIKFTYKDALNKAEEFLKKHPQSSELVPFDKLVDSYKNYSKAVPLKIGFSFCGLGWKTKWSNTDYIFKYQPVWSLVFFGYQIALVFNAPEPYHYWTCWLYYTINTDKNKTVKERIEQAREGFPCKWRNYSNDTEKLICYWDIIIKERYL